MRRQLVLAFAVAVATWLLLELGSRGDVPDEMRPAGAPRPSPHAPPCYNPPADRVITVYTKADVSSLGVTPSEAAARAAAAAAEALPNDGGHAPPTVLLLPHVGDAADGGSRGCLAASRLSAYRRAAACAIARISSLHVVVEAQADEPNAEACHVPGVSHVAWSTLTTTHPSDIKKAIRREFRCDGDTNSGATASADDVAVVSGTSWVSELRACGVASDRNGVDEHYGWTDAQACACGPLERLDKHSVDGCAAADGLAAIARGDLRRYGALAEQVCALRMLRRAAAREPGGRCTRFPVPTGMSPKVLDPESRAFEAIFAVTCVAPQYLPLCALNLGNRAWAAAAYGNESAARADLAARLHVPFEDSKDICRSGCRQGSRSVGCLVMASVLRKGAAALHAAMEFLEPRGVPLKHAFQCTSHVFETLRVCQRPELRAFFAGKGPKTADGLHDLMAKTIVKAKANQYAKHPFAEGDRY